MHPVEWYLSIHDKRDVIEYPISDDLDISGWDIKKSVTTICKVKPSFTRMDSITHFYSKNSNFPEQLQQMSEKELRSESNDISLLTYGFKKLS